MYISCRDRNTHIYKLTHDSISLARKVSDVYAP